MAIGTITQGATGVGGTAGDPIDLRGPNGLLTRVVTVVGDSSYVTGGTAVTQQALGFTNAILFGQAEILTGSGANATSNALSVIVQANGSVKLQAWASTNAEIANATNISGVTWQIILWGY